MKKKITDRFEQLKDLAQNQLQRQLAKTSPKLTEDLKFFIQHPRAFGQWLEGKSPWLNRKLLGAASNIAEPFLVGMGLQVEKLGEESVEVELPGSWRNQGEAGFIHTSAISALGEFAVRLFWEYHLDLRKSEIYPSRVQLQILSRSVGPLKGVFRLPVSEREAILHKLRSSGRAEIDTQTLVYDAQGRLIAEVEVDWTLTRQLTLGPAR